MHFKDMVRLNVEDIKRRKLRSFLTILSIGIGTMLLIVMFGIGNGLTNTINRQVSKILGNSNIVTVNPYELSKDKDKVKVQVGNESTDSSAPKEKKIDESVLSTIKAIDSVKSITAIITSKISTSKLNGIDGKSSSLIGVQPNFTLFSDTDKDTLSKMKDSDRYNKTSKSTIIAGIEPTSLTNTDILVGQKYLDKIGIKDYGSVIGKDMELKFIMPSMGSEVQIPPMIFKGKVIGVINGDYPENYGKSILVSTDTAAKFQEYLTGEKDYINNKGYSEVKVNVVNVDKVKDVTAAITKLNYDFISSVDTIEKLQGQTKIINIIFLAGGLIVLFVASFGLINTMTMSVQEKKKSIGIMKAVGASKQAIGRIFLMQSAMLGFGGGIAGSVLGLITTYIVNEVSISKQVAKGVSDPSGFVLLPLWFLAVAIGFSVVISIVAGIIPSRRAAKLDAVELLSFE